jgi:hypothetical protein
MYHQISLKLTTVLFFLSLKLASIAQLSNMAKGNQIMQPSIPVSWDAYLIANAFDVVSHFFEQSFSAELDRAFP